MRRLLPLGAAVVAAATLLVFSPSINGEFVDWDDDRNFQSNLEYRGLAWTNIRWMLTSATLGHWIPVTWLTLGLDYVLWGMEPAGYHLTNVVLHAVNAALVFLVARRLLTAALRRADARAVAVGAAVAALFWALHPLRVESVAWITERRDVVSGAFYLLTILTYLVAADRAGAARVRWLGASLAAYTLALMSKSIVMTMPVVLIVLDVYPLRRLPTSWRAWWTASARRLWLEKTPYAALAAAGAVTAVIVVARTLTPASTIPFVARPLVFFYDLAFYAWKTIAPFGLSPLYELPHPLVSPALAAVAVTSVALTVALVALRHAFPGGLAVWIVYAASVAPVGGLVHNGAQIAADRYTYLACLGASVLVGGLVATLVGAPPRRAGVVAAGVALSLAALIVLTVRQIPVWRNSEALWTHALAVNPECVRCQRGLGIVLGNRGELEPAIRHFRRAVALRPDLVWYRLIVGEALIQAGRPAEAEQEFRAVIAAYPDHVQALTDLGAALLASNRPAAATPYLERAVALRPSFGPAHVGLVRAYRALGRPDEAARHAAVLGHADPAMAAGASTP